MRLEKSRPPEYLTHLIEMEWGPRSTEPRPYDEKPARSTRGGPYGVNSRLRRARLALNENLTCP